MSINLIISFLIERFFGSPTSRFHPVRLLGRLIYFFSYIFYPFEKKFLGGLFLLLCTILSVSGVMILLEYVKPFLGLPMGINILSIVLIYFLLCNRELAQEARSVYFFLKNGNLVAARQRVARIVGRDTGNLDSKGVIRAAVESIAENIVDGFTSPVFYLLLGGLPFAYVYKAVNTIDSIYGYRNEKFEKFGKAGARLDDIMNFIPARLNALFIFCATGFDKIPVPTVVSLKQVLQVIWVLLLEVLHITGESSNKSPGWEETDFLSMSWKTRVLFFLPFLCTGKLYGLL